MRQFLLFSPACLAICFLLIGGYASASTEVLRMGGTGAGLQLLQRLGEGYMATAPGVAVEIVPSLGTSGGISALADGVLELAIASRALKPTEAEQGLREVGAVRTPFLLVTSRTEPEPLAALDVAAAFAGSAIWADHTPIRVVLRPVTESDTLLLEEFFPGMSEALAQARLRPEIPVAATDQDNAAAAEEMEGSITSATLVQIITEARNLRPIPIDGVAPSLENLQSGRYPYQKTLHFLVSGQSSTAAGNFAEFLGTDAAAAIMRESGVLPAGH